MSKRVDFSYLIGGGFDSVNYYRSESPINPASLPVPMATGIATKNYSDLTAVEGKDYRVRFESIRGVEKKLSGEISIDTSINEVELLIFADAVVFPSTTIVDSSKMPKTLMKTGNVKIVDTVNKLYDDGWIYFDGVNDNLSASISQLGTSDFTFECFIVQDLVNSKSYGRLMQIGQNNALGSILLYRQAASNPATLTLALGNGSGYYYVVVGTKTLQNSIPNHICLMRKSGIFYLFINGDLDGSNNSHQTFSISNNPIFIGSNTDGIEEFSGYFSSIRLTKFARYNTSGFTPTQFKFSKP